MMRWFLALLALCATAPLRAQEGPEWAGVWEGRIGNLPVRACFDAWSDSPGRGSYYYLRYLEPISLSEEDGEGGWIERAPGAETEARWEFAELSATRMRGTWRQGGRNLPFSLDPVAWEDHDEQGPCGSEQFVGPRLQGGKVVHDSAEFEGLRYTKTSFQPPASFVEDVSIETFAYEGNEPGDRSIAATLEKLLPTGKWEDEYIECMAGAIAANGQDGFYSREIKPTLVSRAFFAVEDLSGTYCGGAHPNYWTVARVFDRRTGEELELFEWLDWPLEDGEELRRMPAGLRSLIMRRWPTDADPECREWAQEADYWSLGLAREGLIFSPSLPYVATACVTPIVVEWSALAPLLNDKGRAGLARLMAD